jgi:L,D-peptidoglycan transpeptidase YkuD (ErfK/YbiS/YcfS/YnhG family)
MGDGKTPLGTLRPLSAFGIKPNPGTTMPYIDVTPTTYAFDEDRMVEILRNCDMSLVITVRE